MPKITPGNRLYFYQLFSAELGVGKQTPIARVSEVLAEADVLLEDVECESVEQLVEELSAFLKVTTFRKGRVFVTVLANDELDALLEKAEQAAAEKGEPGAKSWRRARKSKDVRPVKPRHKRKPVAAAQEEAGEDVPETEAGVTEALAPEAEVATDVMTVPPESDAEEAEAPKLEAQAPDAVVVEAPVAMAEPAEEDSRQPEPIAEPEPAEDDHNPAGVPEPQPDERDEEGVAVEPGQGDEKPEAGQETTADQDVPEREATTDQDVPEQEALSAAPRETTTPRNPQRIRTTPKLRRIGLPASISADVYCPSELLAQLYQLLPPTVGIMEALDESWSFAQEAGTADGTRSRLTFPLSRTGRPGHPIEVTVARAARIPSGKAWQLVEVDADDE